MRIVEIAGPGLVLAAASVLACVSGALPAQPEAVPSRAVRPPDWSAPPEAAVRSLDVRLKLVADGAEAGHLEVSMRWSEPPGEFADPGPLLLWMAEEHDDGADKKTEALEDVAARDAEGALTLRPRPAEVDGRAGVEWRSDRRPQGAVTVSYRVKTAPVKSPAQRGFHGMGATLLLTPDTPDTYRVRVVWDLSAAGEGVRAVSSFGAGDASEGRASMDALRSALFMAGALGRVSIEAGGDRFEGVWLGRPGFDPLEAIPWAARVHAFQRGFFGERAPAPFLFVVRAAPRSVFFGAAHLGGLVVVAGEERGFTREVRFTIAGELIHEWLGGEDHGLRFEGAEAWVSGGLAAHFTRELLLRSGLCTLGEAGEELRRRSGRYAASGAREDRAMLYAAEVDAAVRAKSAGARSLDDLVLGLLERARAGGHDGQTAPLRAGAWRELMGAELGASGQARFDAAAGATPFLPPDSVFGPCFRATKKKLPRYELGFAAGSLAEKKVRGLTRGSEAERSGLREGDEIVRASSVEPGETDVAVEVVVRREDGEKSVKYLPRGKAVEGTVWVRDLKAPACRQTARR